MKKLLCVIGMWLSIIILMSCVVYEICNSLGGGNKKCLDFAKSDKAKYRQCINF